MFCKMCGAQIPDGGQFCPVCGAPVPAANAGPQPPEGPAAGYKGNDGAADLKRTEELRAEAPQREERRRQAQREEKPDRREKQPRPEKPQREKRRKPEREEGPVREKPPKSQRKSLGWLIAVLSVVLVLGAAALAGSLVLYLQGEDGGRSSVTVPASELDREAYRQQLGLEESTQAEASAESLERGSFAVPDPSLATSSAAATTAAAAGEYIFPDSNTRYLTRAEVEALDDQQLRLARNEIFARLGRTFVDQELQAYFNSKSWYVGRYTPEEFDAMGDSILNQYEMANSQLITEVEDARRQQ